MISVSSSNLRAVDYDEYSGTLYIRFRSGRTYAYYNVPFHRFEGLLNAGSKGRYFHSFIRNLYPYSRV